MLLEAGRERVSQLEGYIEKMRINFNSEKEEFLEEVKELKDKLENDHQKNYLKDLVFKFLIEDNIVKGFFDFF